MLVGWFVDAFLCFLCFAAGGFFDGPADGEGNCDAEHLQLTARPPRRWHQRQLSWPCVGNHSEYRSLGDGWGWTSRLAVQEGSSKDPVMLVWTSFLAAPFGEAIPWPTLLGEPSGLASMARPGLRVPRGRTHDPEPARKSETHGE